MLVDAPGQWGTIAASDAAVSPCAGSLLMPFLALHVVFSLLLDRIPLLMRSDQDKSLELVLLRQQLRL